MFPDIAVVTCEPAIETVPRHTGVGRTVENEGDGSATNSDEYPVVLVSY